MKKLIFYSLGVLFLATGCSINRNLMFKTDQDFVYDTPVFDSTNTDYRIAPNDVISFQLFTNEGAAILEFTTSSTESPRYFNFKDFNYLVDSYGKVDLPTLGPTEIKGLTIREAQQKLESLYADQFNYPYAVVLVLNHRITVFPGGGASAQVVPLLNQNTSIIEALALAGGIADRGNASKVKLIRRKGGKNEVYLFDLSTIEGIQYLQVIVQAGDIIYVEPVPDLASEFLKDLAPFVSIVSGIALIYAILVKGF